MELERLGSPELGCRFMTWYFEFSGDNAPLSLAHHYIAYRAFVRAEVACLRHHQGGAPEAAVDATQHLAVVARNLAAGAVRPVLVGGPPGSGKSTVAGGLADAHEFTVLSSDRIRKELAGAPVEQSMASAFGAGIYTSEWTAATYAELVRRAELLLGLGESVVLDAMWADPQWRLRAQELAKSTSSVLHALRCRLPEEVAARRLTSREGPLRRRR